MNGRTELVGRTRNRRIFERRIVKASASPMLRYSPWEEPVSEFPTKWNGSTAIDFARSPVCGPLCDQCGSFVRIGLFIRCRSFAYLGSFLIGSSFGSVANQTIHSFRSLTAFSNHSKAVS